ncbi:MAG TPA: 3-oxoacyl-ACP reductase [Ruminococcaceae bacterium]|nr:3-oxoacyl-ACP reductase [Oscillospiraceae bacterium]
MEKTAVITGSSRGIGRACALKLAEKGFNIVVNYNSNEEAANKAVEEIAALGRRAMAVRADTSDLKQVQDMFRTAFKEMGSIDVLVNNAGVVSDAYLLMLSAESLQKSLDINIKGYFNCAQQAALKMMKNKRGSIINISSVSGIHALAGQSAYSATKGAVNSMTMVLAKELAPYGIQVNAVAPGFVETEMITAVPEEKLKEYLDAIPMKRFARAEEIAETVSLLADGSLSYITGQVIVMDGGLSL